MGTRHHALSYKEEALPIIGLLVQLVAYNSKVWDGSEAMFEGLPLAFMLVIGAALVKLESLN